MKYSILGCAFLFITGVCSCSMNEPELVIEPHVITWEEAANHWHDPAYGWVCKNGTWYWHLESPIEDETNSILGEWVCGSGMHHYIFGSNGKVRIEGYHQGERFECFTYPYSYDGENLKIGTFCDAPCTIENDTMYCTGVCGNELTKLK